MNRVLLYRKGTVGAEMHGNRAEKKVHVPLTISVPALSTFTGTANYAKDRIDQYTARFAPREQVRTDRYESTLCRRHLENDERTSPNTAREKYCPRSH